MSRAFCIPGIILLFIAFVLSLIVSISLPTLPAIDITRTTFDVGSSSNAQGINEVRFGIWSFCTYAIGSDSSTCSNSHHGYHVQVQSPTNSNSGVTIGSSWTRGLAVHPVATAVIFIAFLLSFSTHVTVTLISSLVSFLAAFLTFLAFIIDIALFAFVKHEMKKLDGVSAKTRTGSGFWMTFVVLILLLLAGCTVCFGRRRDRMSSAGGAPPAKRPFFSRFRRNRY